MKTFKLLSLAVLLCSMAFISCGDDDDTNQMETPSTIVDIASENADLTSLVAALQAADLATTLQGDGPFTVFAPTNAAFDAFLAANNFDALGDVPVDVLTSILLNHVVSGKVESSGLSTGYVESLATGMNMYISTASGVRINEDID